MNVSWVSNTLKTGVFYFAGFLSLQYGLHPWKSGFIGIVRVWRATFNWQNFHTRIGCDATAVWRAPPVLQFVASSFSVRRWHWSLLDLSLTGQFIFVTWIFQHFYWIYIAFILFQLHWVHIKLCTSWYFFCSSIIPGFNSSCSLLSYCLSISRLQTKPKCDYSCIDKFSALKP